MIVLDNVNVCYMDCYLDSSTCVGYVTMQTISYCMRKFHVLVQNGVSTFKFPNRIHKGRQFEGCAMKRLSNIGVKRQRLLRLCSVFELINFGISLLSAFWSSAIALF